MTPESALRLLQKQPLPVRRAVECLLLAVDPQGLALFGQRYTTGAAADELMGRPSPLAGLGVVAEFPLEG